MPSSAVRTFADPDDWTTTFRGSEAELTITARGQFSAQLTWIRLHCLQMQRFFDNLPRILHVAHVHRRATISFLAPQGPSQRWGGTELAPGDIMLHAASSALVPSPTAPGSTPARSAPKPRSPCRSPGYRVVDSGFPPPPGETG